MKEKQVDQRHVDYTPSNIFCCRQDSNYGIGAFWGIILPKNHFLKFWEEEKGPWPTGQETDYSRYGTSMPTKLHRKDGDFESSKSSNDKETYLPVEDFMNKENRFGALVFGDKLFSPSLDRKLGFEVLGSRGDRGIYTFPVNALEDILMMRHLITSEYHGGRINPGSDPAFHFKVIERYFNGDFVGKKGKKLLHSEGHPIKTLVEIFRTCEFPERLSFRRTYY